MPKEKRLIDANALDAKLDELMTRYSAQGRKEVADDYNFVRTVLLTAPTVDAVEVVHGRWEQLTLGAICRCCNNWNNRSSNYCPNRRAMDCCKNCVHPKRHMACWGHCPEYLAERAEDDRLKDAEDRKIDEILSG